MAKSPEQWLKNEIVPRGTSRRGFLSALEEHRSASKSACRNAPDRRPVDGAVGSRNAMDEDGKML
jgi:hypothetical protein